MEKQILVAGRRMPKGKYLLSIFDENGEIQKKPCIL